MTVTSELRTHTLHLAGSIDPDLMTGAQAAAAVEDLAVADKALSSTLMFVALRVARTNAWQGQGYKSAADWLAAKAGVSVREAHRLLGTAKKAEGLDKTKEAMKRGDLSPDQADAVTDAATADPDAEEDLLGCAARDTNQNLSEEAAKRKAAATDSAARERRIRQQRSLRTGTNAEGAFWARIYGPGMDAARFEALIRPFEEIVFRQHRREGRRDTYENRRYDAFMLMLAFYAQLATATRGSTPPEPETAPQPEAAPAASSTGSGGAPARAGAASGRRPGPETQEASGEPPAPGDADQTPTPANADSPVSGPPDPESAAPPGGPPPSTPPPDGPASGSPTGSPPQPQPTWSPPWDPDQAAPLPAKVPGGDNVKVIVNVDHTALLRGHSVAGETCEIAGIGPVSVQAVRDILAGDPFLAVVVKKGRDVVTVAHHGRGLNAAQRTAIEAGGLRCSNIACNRTVAIQIDHRTPYADDPVTKLDNQDPLCPDCHRLKTHRGHHLEPGRGPRRLLPPGHPDNPLNRDTGNPPAPGRDELPTGQALNDLMDRRPLTDHEHHQLETRVSNQLAAKGIHIEQPTLC